MANPSTTKPGLSLTILYTTTLRRRENPFLQPERSSVRLRMDPVEGSRTLLSVIRVRFKTRHVE